jgi:hypothetical protein
MFKIEKRQTNNTIADVSKHLDGNQVMIERYRDILDRVLIAGPRGKQIIILGIHHPNIH